MTEAVWGLLKPKVLGSLPSIIVCCFYSPPDMKKNSVLLNHLTLTIHSLLNIHKNAGLIVCGNRNRMEISDLLSIEPSLKQIVRSPTHGRKVLDVILTNLTNCYQASTILPPLMPDNPSVAAPSDYSGVQILPINKTIRPERNKVVKIIRPLPDSLLMNFKQKMSQINFESILHNLPSDDMITTFQNISSNLLTETFPERKICVYSDDKPWYTE